jgi:primosomal protein N' (replication factor Y)
MARREDLSLPLLADVALPLPVPHPYTYAVPDEYAGALGAGSRVLVPLGAQRLIGYVVAVGRRQPPRGLKPVLDLIDEEPLLDEGLLRFCARLAELYLCSLGEVLKAALPPGINGTVRCLFEEQRDPALRKPLRLSAKREAILRLVRERGTVSRAWLTQELSGSLAHDLTQLVAAGFLVRRESLEGERRRESLRRVLALAVAPGGPELREALKEKEKRAPRQAALLRLLGDGARVERAEILAQGWTAAQLKPLLEAGLLREDSETELPEGGYDHDASVRGLELTSAQAAVVEAVAGALPGPGKRPGRFQTFLLRGVTGSGKTQVYLELARQARAAGLSVLVLVPEIALTPQIVARFQGFLGSHVAVIHSQLSGTPALQHLARHQARRGAGGHRRPQRPVRPPAEAGAHRGGRGARELLQAVQEPVPRYHARDAAVLRGASPGHSRGAGQRHPVAGIWFNARQGKLPADHVAGARQRPSPARGAAGGHEGALRAESAGKGRTVRNFSHSLIEAWWPPVQAGGQAIVLQNRRGYSPWLQCPLCAEVLHCPLRHLPGLAPQHGQLPLPPLRRGDPAARACPACKEAKLACWGAGTQKVEEELEEVLPEARILRMDRDTTAGRDAYVKMVRDFNSGSYDILLGTKSVAKGLDFSP